MYGTPYKDGDDLNGKYIIWSPGAVSPPRYVFDDRPAAIKAAFAMAKNNPSQRFTVCKIVGEAAAVEVKYESYSE